VVRDIFSHTTLLFHVLYISKNRGKIRIDAKPVKVYADASLVFPILVAQTFAKLVWGETKLVTRLPSSNNSKAITTTTTTTTTTSSVAAGDESKTSNITTTNAESKEVSKIEKNGNVTIEMLEQKGHGMSDLKTNDKKPKVVSSTEKKILAFGLESQNRKSMTFRTLITLTIGVLLLVLGIVGIVFGATVADNDGAAVLISMGIIILTTSLILFGCNAPVVHGRSLWDRVSLFVMEESLRQDELVASIIKESQTPTGHHLVYGNL